MRLLLETTKEIILMKPNLHGSKELCMSLLRKIGRNMMMIRVEI